MNRVIKFRGKRIDSGNWIYGHFVQDPERNSRIYLKPFDDATSNTYFMVHTDTVGQFTGLTDKNGVEIYESDIVKVTDGADGLPHEMKGGIYKVAYSQLDAQFMLVQLDEKGAICFDEVCEYEVIGKIYDNA